MSELTSLPQFKSYAVAAAILTLNLIALAMYTASRRWLARTIVNPEDAAITPRPTVADADDPAVQRIARAHRNALENIAPFLVIGLLYVLSGASQAGAKIY